MRWIKSKIKVILSCMDVSQAFIDHQLHIFQRILEDPHRFHLMKNENYYKRIDIVWIGHVEKFTKNFIITRRLVNVIQVNGTLDIQAKKYQQQVQWVLMKFYGHHTGHAVDKDGSPKVAGEHSIMVYSWMSMLKLPENMNGQIGDSKHSSRKT